MPSADPNNFLYNTRIATSSLLNNTPSAAIAKNFQADRQAQPQTPCAGLRPSWPHWPASMWLLLLRILPSGRAIKSESPAHRWNTEIQRWRKKRWSRWWGDKTVSGWTRYSLHAHPQTRSHVHANRFPTVRFQETTHSQQSSVLSGPGAIVQESAWGFRTNDRKTTKYYTVRVYTSRRAVNYKHPRRGHRFPRSGLSPRRVWTSLIDYIARDKPLIHALIRTIDCR